MENPGDLHLEENPELQENDGEENRCNQTQSHPEKEKIVVYHILFTSEH